jgi:hypothetical protein
MKFVIIYQNRDDVRNFIVNWLKDAIRQGAQFHAQPVETPFVKTRLYWPPTSELVTFPMSQQCEELEFKDGKFVTSRVLIFEAEIVPNVEKDLQMYMNI